MLDRAVEQGVKAVSFTGGEPLLDLDDLVDLIRYAGSLGIEYIRTGTNGFLFSDHIAEDFEKQVNLISSPTACNKIIHCFSIILNRFDHWIKNILHLVLHQFAKIRLL